MQQTKKKLFGEYNYLFQFLLKVAIVLIAFLCVYQFVFEIHIYHGNDMYPSIKDGDLLFVYKIGDPIAEDAVVYKNKETGAKEVSRVFARDYGQIDFTPEGEPTLNGGVVPGFVFYKSEKKPDSPVEFPLNLEDGDIFLLDDYRTIGR